MGRIEVGSWSDTCQEACRLPSGQGFRWLKARTVPEGPGAGICREQQVTLRSPRRQWGREA